MSVTWRGVPSPPPRRLTWGGRARAAARLALLAPLLLVLVLAHLVARAAERAVHGARRPWTPHLRRWGCRAALGVIGLRRRVVGRPARGPGAQVANHAGWLDIWALASASPATFVAKAEVRGWPVVGWVAAQAGTVFVERRRGASAAQQSALRERLLAGDTLALFPEGTSTDGRRVLPFKSTLFATFLAPGLEAARIQPVTLAYRAPEGERADLYGWWGSMALLPHLMEVLAVPRRGEVEIVFHEPIPVGAHPDRKALAALCEAAVRDGLRQRVPAPAVVSAAAR